MPRASGWERSNAVCRAVPGAELVRVGAGGLPHRREQLDPHGPGLDPASVARLPVRPGGSGLCFPWPEPLEGAVEHLARRG